MHGVYIPKLTARWPDPRPEHIPLLKQARIRAVVMDRPVPEFEKAEIEVILERNLRTFEVSTLPASAPPPVINLATGRWPGIGREAVRDGNAANTLASASREPWVDSNAYWIAWLRALYPNSTPVLAYQANAAAGLDEGRIVPFDTLTLALAEARVMGGNYILSLDPAYRKALLASDPKATAAWKQLGVTAEWLDATQQFFGHGASPTITALVEPGDATAEIANLLFRRNASPRLIAEVPDRLPPGTNTLVTTAIKPPSPAVAQRILNHVADSGITVVTDDPSPKAWWRSPRLKLTKTQDDRLFYTLGKGQIVAYKEPIVDPSEHALDIIDLATHPRRAVRIWNANAAIAVSSPGIVHLLNYASRARTGDAQVRILGAYKTALLLRPGAAPVTIEASRRGSTTEVFVPDLAPVNTVVFR